MIWDEEPIKKLNKPADLSDCSIDELAEKIITLKAEIARIEAEIEKKQKHKSSIENLFKS